MPPFVAQQPTLISLANVPLVHQLYPLLGMAFIPWLCSKSSNRLQSGCEEFVYIYEEKNFQAIMRF